MSDPQTFEELKRMARELPKNVLVPAQHIHSLLDETEWLVELSVDLKRQLTEEKEKLTEAKADILEHHLQDEECRKAAGEFDKSDSFGIESPLDIIERMKAEIEAMRPVVEAATSFVSDPYPQSRLHFLEVTKNYLDRKQP